MEEVVILVAGNPDLYPLEYYNAETETYEGVIPQLLAQFSEDSYYEIQYLQSGSEDRRESLARNQQIDLISGCMTGDEYEHVQSGVTLFETLEDGETLAYQLFFTDQAPESFQNDFRDFLSGISQEERTGMLLQIRSKDMAAQTGQLWKGIIGLSVVIFILLGIMTALFFLHRKLMKKNEMNKETDELTGLGNRAFLEHVFPIHVTDRTRILYTAICFYTDTDKDNRIRENDDALQFLRHTASVLNEYTDQNDLLVRISGVGFVMFKSSQSVQEWIPTALTRIREFSTLYEKSSHYSVNCGIYLLQRDDRDLDEILLKILQGAQLAQKNREDYVICTQDIIRKLNQERQLQREIVSAFERKEFQLYIQFYVNAQTFRIIGGEALTRWQHPEMGFLTPDIFIPMMEREDLIGDMDYYILEKVCGFQEELRRRGIHDFFISCNFSKKTFGAPDFIQRCKEILAPYSFDRELLIFELTENSQIRDTPLMLENAHRIKKELGVQLLLDNMGTEFTSFHDFLQYPADGIKLSKELVSHLDTEKGRSFMQIIVKIGHESGLTTLVQGVETEEQMRILQELNCDVLQGFFFYHPVPEWEAEEILLEG